MSEIVDSHSYKRYHEEFMQNLNGTSAAEIFLLILPAPISVFLSNFVIALCIPLLGNATSNLRNDIKFMFCIDFTVIIVPLILCFTVLSECHIVVTSGLLMGLLSCLAFCWISQDKGDEFSKKIFRSILTSTITESRRPYITNFRALTNLMTAICILAVDFKVFPRRFAKTENFGYGLMDTGVGLFVISNAIVAPQGKLETFSSSLGKALRSCIPLILLGGARFFATKQIDYQTHISEYGVHWNFFITLAVTKIMCTIIISVMRGVNMLLLPVLLVTAHQVMLSSGMQDWVLSNVSRQDFLSANREGIVSSLGYIALYFAGACLAKELKSYGSSFQNNLVSMGKLSIVSILLWSIASLCRHCFGVSRRLANLGYFTWILALSVSMIAVLLFVELVLKSLNVMNFSIGYVPLTLDAINFNGLAFFLLANLLTGLINVSVRTLYVDPVPSVMILCGYTFILCWLILLLYVKHFKLKI